ncbi:penicillin-binding protein [Couchioplanes caeruleus subsp. caeruleus]|uniref:Penicillin-binding protein n=1 Tax=Couchioplanes caeruleus subsp. caeruleus TaxID=56427 RepID=A0A1K0FJ07_9ACTN|nr:penicillin-binding protein [Couchioplanes caeruleus subsp. caeruleus]
MMLSRRTLLGAAAAGGAAALVGGRPASAAAKPRAVRDLEEKIQAGMAAYRIPGVAYGLRFRGADYVGGFGVTNLDDPAPVDADTVFRVGSTSKTFVGTAVMRLVERGGLDLHRTVRSYLPDFRTADPAASARVTVREALDHSAGWLGDFFLDTGEGEDALARYVAGMSRLPQLTPPGRAMAYNNAALGLAGRLIEVATGETYERAVRSLVLDPLHLRHSAFTLDELPGVPVATSHVYDGNGEPVAYPEGFRIWRSLNPAGGLISSARDQLRWANFHLGDGGRLLTRESMRRMQSRPGPGGTLFVEVDGFGVTWMLRPTAEGPLVVQHGGDWTGQHSGFLMVPEREFALTVLTNAETGPALLAELFADDWALSRFAGVHNLRAVPRPLSASALAPYAGTYTGEQIGPDGTTAVLALDLVPDAGRLSIRFDGVEAGRLAFYRRDYALVLDPTGAPAHTRVNFLRDGGKIAWLRFGGRLLRHGPASAGSRRPLHLNTLPY